MQNMSVRVLETRYPSHTCLYVKWTALLTKRYSKEDLKKVL